LKDIIYSYAGEALKKEFGLELGRITGLDPADPHFEETDPMVRLDETDAFYVDAIHTDANPLLSGFN
jgi:pancreatic triacylglycerol lipase